MSVRWRFYSEKAWPEVWFLFWLGKSRQRFKQILPAVAFSSGDQSVKTSTNISDEEFKSHIGQPVR